MNDKLLLNLNACVNKSRGGTAQKIMRAPVRLIYSKLLEKYCINTNTARRVRTRTFWGGDMTVVFPEAISCFLFRYGFFEENLSTIVLTHVKPGGVFFDIGTHFGYFSLLASHLVGAQGQVHSFEPTPSTFEISSLNLAARHNVTLNNMAVWSESAALTFKDYGVRFSAFNSIYGAKISEEKVRGAVAREISIKTVNIDQYIEDSGARPDFIKIDAESAEYEILQGMEKTLTQIRPAISVEVGDIREGDFIDSREAVDYLLKYDYRAYQFQEGRLAPHQPQQEYLYDNLLFLPA
jgi:FkbM family methyltransferase